MFNDRYVFLMHFVPNILPLCVSIYADIIQYYFIDPLTAFVLI